MSTLMNEEGSSLACSKHGELAVDQLILGQFREVVLSERVPARHVGGVADGAAALGGWSSTVCDQQGVSTAESRKQDDVKLLQKCSNNRSDIN